MVFQNYQNFIEMTSNMIYIVALGVGFKCPHKIHLNTQWGGGRLCQPQPIAIREIILKKTTHQGEMIQNSQIQIRWLYHKSIKEEVVFLI